MIECTWILVRDQTRSHLFSFSPHDRLHIIQVGEFSNPEGEYLEKGASFRLDLDTAKGDKNRVQLPHPEIIAASEVGHALLIDDGKVKLTVTSKGDSWLYCRVDVPGKIKVCVCLCIGMRSMQDPRSHGFFTTMLSPPHPHRIVKESIPQTVFWKLVH